MAERQGEVMGMKRLVIQELGSARMQRRYLEYMERFCLSGFTTKVEMQRGGCYQIWLVYGGGDQEELMAEMYENAHGLYEYVTPLGVRYASAPEVAAEDLRVHGPIWRQFRQMMRLVDPELGRREGKGRREKVVW